MPLTHFHDIDFPMPLREGLRCRLRCLTEVATTRNHSEQRHCAWFDPLWEIDLEPVIEDQEDFDRLVNFWRARKGASFRFRHPLDQEAVNVQIGTGTSTTTQYQLLQAYTSGYTGDTYTARRIVHLPVASTVTITLNDTLTTAYTLNATTGVVTFDAAPGAGVVIRWSGTYDLPMRFLAQEMPTELVQAGRFANTFTLVEDRASPAVTPGVAEEILPVTVLSRLPLEMAEGSLFGPVHRLLVLSGEEEVSERIDVQAGTRLTASIGYRHRPWAEIQRLLAFFWGRRGRYASFQVHDPSDFTASSPSFSGTGNGTLAVFPVRKAYISGAGVEYRRLYRPVGEVRVYLDAVLQTSDYTLNSTRGEVTFTTPPAEGVEVATACDAFDTLVRFDTDTLEVTLDAVNIASVSGLELTAVNDEPVALTYQAGQVGRPVASVAGCGVPAFAPPAPVPLALEFGHDQGPGTSALEFHLGDNPVSNHYFYGLLTGINLFTAGFVFSHASAGVLMDLGGTGHLGIPDGAAPPFAGPAFAPWFRCGLADSSSNLFGTGAPMPVDSTHLTAYGRAGSGGSLPILLNDPCNPNTRSWTTDAAQASDNLGIISGGPENRLGPLSGGVVPSVTVLIISICIGTASVYCSGSIYGKQLMAMNGLTGTWFEHYTLNDAGGCWTVSRSPANIWLRQIKAAVWLREALVGGYRGDNFTSYGGGGKFLLYELILQRTLIAGLPALPSLIALPPAGAEAVILAQHQAMLRYFLFRYQLGVHPSYGAEGVLGHWTMDTLQAHAVDVVLPEPWESNTGGMVLRNTGVGGSVSSPILRAVTTPSIPIESDLRLFDGSSVLTGRALTTPVGG